LRAEVDVRTTRQQQLEATQGELRAELGQLAGLVEQEGSRRADVESRAVVLAAEVADLQAQLGDLESELDQVRAELAQTVVAREAADGEVIGLRSEVERLGRELAEMRGLGDSGNGLEEAESLLAEARALAARLREPDRFGSGD
jgi:chromosome segregation ATPase